MNPRYVVYLALILVLLGLLGHQSYTRMRTSVENSPEQSPLIYAEQRESYGYPELSKDIRSLSKAYSDWISVESIGESVSGRNLYAVHLGAESPKLLVVGAHHGREWITSKLLVKALREYAEAAVLDQEISGFHLCDLLQQIGIVFVPMLNPDGVEISLKGVSAGENRELLLAANDGQEDFSRWKGNANGVNLNIQYDGNWDLAATEPEPHFEKYKGSKPESEPESRALAELVRIIKPMMILSYHASGQVIYWHYGQDSPVLERDRKIVQELARLTGYQVAEEPDLHTNGGLKDWFIQTFQRPGFTIEVGEPVGDGPVPLEQFETIWEENKAAILYAATTTDSLVQK